MELLPAAEGIHRVVNTNMAEGIRLVSVRRGVDPRRFTLLAFGGAAGLHVTEVARLLEIGRVIVPRVAAVLSAWGMLATDLRYELVRTHMGEARRVGAPRLRQVFAGHGGRGPAAAGRGFAGRSRIQRAVDMRYGEQIFEISVPLDGVDLDAGRRDGEVVARFHKRHEELYTYSAPDQEVVLVNARAGGGGRAAGPARSNAAVATARPAAPAAPARVYLERLAGGAGLRPGRAAAGPGNQGPAIFESATTTVLIRARRAGGRHRGGVAGYRGLGSLGLTTVVETTPHPALSPEGRGT